MVNANVRLLARNNEVLGTVKTDSRGYARFDAGLKRGEGGLAPAVLVAETPEATTPSSTWPRRPSISPTAASRAAIAPGPIDAFAYTDRGVYRPGEQVHLAALARDRTGKASARAGHGHRLAARWRRALARHADRPGPRRPRHHARARRLGHDRHLARQGPHRPQGRPIAQAAFLVEDFVPERLELKLEPAVQALSPQEPGTIKLAGRYLYGPPAAGLAVEGEIAVKLAKGDLPGFAGYKFGLADEQVAPVRKPLEGLPATDAEGKADIAVRLPALPKTSRPLEADVILKLRESGGRTIERTVTLPVDLKAAAHRHQAAVRRRPGRRKASPPRFEAIVLGADGKAVDGQGPQVGADAPRPALAVVQPRRLVDLRARDETRRVATGTADATAGAPAKIEAKVDWGRYRLEVSAADGSGLISSMVFTAGY